MPPDGHQGYVPTRNDQPPYAEWTPGLTDDALIYGAVLNARSRRCLGVHPRWRAVSDTFGLDYAYAVGLCERFAFDPKEAVY